MGQLDTKVFRDFSYGLYIITSGAGGRRNGQLVNTVIQVTSEPPRVAVTINKKNFTHELIKQSKAFGASILDEAVTMLFLGPFGFRCGRDVDKLTSVEHKTGITGVPLVTQNCLGILEARVFAEMDLGTHTIFIGDVVSSEVLRQGNPLTYRYYHQNLKGKTPPNAPSYQAPQ